MKAQKNIWDFYSICKKKLDRLHAKKLNQSKNAASNKCGENGEASNSSTRSPSQKKKKSPTRPSECQEPSRVTRNSPIKMQPKLEIDNETRQIILRSNTIIDQTKSPVKNPNCCRDDFVFKKPSSPAPRARRRLDVSLSRKSFSDFKPKRCLESSRDSSFFDSKRFKSSINLADSDQLVNNENAVSKVPRNEFKVRKRLFDNSLDNVKERVQADSTDEFLTKLKDFQQKTSASNRFNISFYSPSKRARERQERATKTMESVNYSPKKFLEDKLKSSSPCKSSNLSIENLEPPRNSTPTKQFSSLGSPQKASTAFNLSSFILTSPFKSPIKSKIADLSLPDKYLELFASFESLDVVVSQLHNRSVACTFDKVKLNYRKLVKKDLDLKQLAQMISIFPNAYLVKSDKSTDGTASLLLKPNIVSSKMIQFTLQIRASEFQDRLLQFAKRAHDEYLRSLERPIVLAGAQLKRWHPSFQFPDVPEAKLPEQVAVLSPKKGSLDELNKSEEEIEVVFDDNEEESQ